MIRGNRILFIICVFNFHFSYSQESKSDKEKYVSEYDSLLLNYENLERLKNLDSIVAFLNNEKRFVYYYDSDWKSTSKDKAVFINTVFQLEDSLFLIRDYFISGKIQMSGIYKKLNDDLDWSKLNDWTRMNAGARKVGKFIHWTKMGLIDHIQYYEYSDFRNGYSRSFRLNVEDFQKPYSTDFAIRNTSKCIVDVLIDITDNLSKELTLPDYFGGIRTVYDSQLKFIFAEKILEVKDTNVIAFQKLKDFSGSSPAIYNSRQSAIHNFDYSSSIGRIQLKFTNSSCDDTDFNTLLMKSSSGQILIEGLLNTEIFLIDGNGDGVDELYIFSFRSCSNGLKLIRISNAK
jgi:hypothetical protein